MSNDLEERLRQYRIILDAAVGDADRPMDGSGAPDIDGDDRSRAGSGLGASGRAFAAALVIVVFVAGVFAVRTGSSRRRTTVAATVGQTTSTSAALDRNAAISVQLVLDQNVVRAGTPILGFVEITNPTGQAATARICDVDPWPTVFLTSPTLQYEIPTSAVLCNGAATLPPGTTRRPVTISTTYPACSYPTAGFVATASIPFCVGTSDPPSQLPPLPPGNYKTEIVMPPVSHQVELPRPTDVTLR